MFVVIGVDNFFYGCTFNLSAHLKILQKKLTNIEFEVKSKMFNKLELSKVFRHLCQYHSQILEICKELNEIYVTVILTQFLLSAMNLCVIAYHLSKVSKYNQEIF